MGGEILRCAQDDNGGQESDPGLGGGVTMEGKEADPWGGGGGDIVSQLGLMGIRADKSAVIRIKLSKSPSTSVGAREVESGWEGLYGRPSCLLVPVHVVGLLPNPVHR